jgi:hypothetical protein
MLKRTPLWFRTPNEPHDGVMYLSRAQKVAWLILAAIVIYLLAR